MLIGSITLVIICELINTAIENLVNRIDPSYHELSGKIKDVGSAIVFVALIFALSIWGYSIFYYFI
jgi:diacylglycerol kinase (ATP)